MKRSEDPLKNRLRMAIAASVLLLMVAACTPSCSSQSTDGVTAETKAQTIDLPASVVQHGKGDGNR